MPESWATDAVFEELQRAADRGETLSRAELQANVGLGAGDLDAALNSLRTAARVREDTPDGWTAAAPAPDPPPPAAEVHEPPEDSPAAQGIPIGPLPGRPRAFAGIEDEEIERERETVLSRAMVESLEPAALGALVLAGVKGESGPFVLRVEP